MRIQELLSKEELKKMKGIGAGLSRQSNRKRKRTSKQHSKLYSKRELDDLMGVNRDRYKKVNGRVRRK